MTGVAEDVAPLDLPLEEDFRVGSLALAWDPDERLLVVGGAGGDRPVPPAEPLSDAPEGPDVLRVRLTPAAAWAFVERARNAWWRPAGRRARCAGCRWTRRATSARGRTVTGTSRRQRPASATLEG